MLTNTTINALRHNSIFVIDQNYYDAEVVPNYHAIVHMRKIENQ